ncbi:2TM domain-containing protein [Spongiimicrobium salis]|uniref:2TM domain-containing protein n=1 Tax=Spongiimicrobium salis TaxID=1667022 RepID=UPI00374CD263
MKEMPSEHFAKARTRVNRIKRFYKHLMVYVSVNIIILLIKGIAWRFFMDEGITDQGFYDWFKLNMLLTPIFWGIGLFIHGLLVFRYPGFTIKSLMSKGMRNWEERQIQKYLKEDDKS